MNHIHKLAWKNYIFVKERLHRSNTKKERAIVDGIDVILGIEIKNKEKGKGKHIRQDYRIRRIRDLKISVKNITKPPK